MDKQRGQGVAGYLLILSLVALVVMAGVALLGGAQAFAPPAGPAAAGADTLVNEVEAQMTEWEVLMMDTFGTWSVDPVRVNAIVEQGWVAKPPVEWPSDNVHLDAHGFSTAAMWERCNPNAMLQRKSDGRWALPCQIDDEWYVFIAEAMDEITGKMRGVTGFRNRAKTLEDVIRYLLQRGYGL